MNTNQDQHRVAFYIRVSTDEQAEKYGLDLQKASLEALIKSKGMLDDGREAMVLAGLNYVYIDEGISGQTEPRERPAFARLMEDIEQAPSDKPPFDVVIAYKIDRFARRLKVLLDIVEFFESHKIQFVSANESIDTSSPFGKAILGILGVIAELEIETTQMRTHDGKQQAIDRGIFMGRVPPYGYIKNVEKMLVPIEKEVITVKNIFSWFVYEHLSFQQIATRLSNTNILSPDASAVFNKKRKGDSKKRNVATFWRYDSVKSIIEDEIYIGNYYYNKTKKDKTTKKSLNLPKTDWKLSKYKYPYIIEPYVFRDANRLVNLGIKKVFRAKEISINRVYPLSGLLKCASCAENGHMFSWTGTKKKISKNDEPIRYSYSYICSKKDRTKFSNICNTIPIPAKPLEDYIKMFILKLLEDPQMVFQHQQELKSSKIEIANLKAKRESYREQINNVPRRKENIRSQHTNGIINDQQLKEEIAKQEESLKKYDIELEKINKILGEQELTDGYIEAFERFSNRYKAMLNQLETDDTELARIFGIMIEKIVIGSRPVLEIDSIAGKKKPDQLMPYSIEIQLRLPKEILTQLIDIGFGVNTNNW